MMPQSAPRIRFRWIAIALFVIWVFAISTVFYVMQKPLTLTGIQMMTQANTQPFVFSGSALGRTLLDLLVALWLCFIGLGLGGWLYHWLGLADSDEQVLWRLEKIIFSLSLGLSALGFVVLAIGLLGLLSRPILYGLMLILTVVAISTASNTIKQVSISLPPRLIAVYLALSVGLALTLAMLPPTDWDGLFYHLTGPKLYLETGSIRPGIDIPHLNFPSLFEMLYALGLALRGDISAKLLHFVFSLLLAMLVYLLAKKHLAVKNSWLAVLLLFSMPMTLTLAGWAYNDLALAFYQVAALYAFLQWQTVSEQNVSEAKRWLILSGILTGLAMGLKYTSFVAPATIVGLLLWRQWQNHRTIGQILRNVTRFCLTALLVALPWYLKNWLFTGNPVYPFVFDGLFWDQFRAAAYAGAGSGIGFNPSALLTLPYDLTLGLQDANYIDGRTGPLFLIFLPFILLYGLFRYRRPLPAALSALLIFALAQYLFWTLGAVWSAALWQSRLLLPAFVALCPVLAWILEDLRHLNHPQFSLQRFLYLFIGIVLVLGLIDQLFSERNQTGWVYHRPLYHVLGSESRADYLNRRLTAHYAAMQAINTELPADSVVAFLWEPRSYYCQRDCRPDSILDEYGHLQYLYGPDAAAVAQAWHSRGITHILVHRLGYNFLRNEAGVPPELRPDPKLLTNLETDHLELIFDIAGAYQGYRLK